MASPRDATRAGIAMIQQELSLVPELAVDENIFLGQEKVRSFFIVDRERQVRAAVIPLTDLMRLNHTSGRRQCQSQSGRCRTIQYSIT